MALMERNPTCAVLVTPQHTNAQECRFDKGEVLLGFGLPWLHCQHQMVAHIMVTLCVHLMVSQVVGSGARN